MSFQAYIDNVHAKTGKWPEDFRELATQAGIYKRDMKAMDLVNWLKREFGLGHGHAMSIYAYFKFNGWVDGPSKPKKRP